MQSSNKQSSSSSSSKKDKSDFAITKRLSLNTDERPNRKDDSLLNQIKSSHGKKKQHGDTDAEINEISNKTNSLSIKQNLIKKIGCYSQAGKGEDGFLKVNQDSYLVMKNVFKLENFNIFSVLDGHGMNGHIISQYVSNYLKNHIERNKHLKVLSSEEEIYSALKKNDYDIISKLFIHAEKDLSKTETDANFSGTTCVTLFQLGNKLICANVGDSRCIMVTKDDVVPLSIDQKPNDEKESSRITKSGGEISQYEENGIKAGPYRVWEKGEMYPGIAMSRSIGDFVATRLGVIPDPVFIEKEIGSDCKYIILASDGVWEFLDNNMVKELVDPFYAKNDPDGACKLLIKESTRWWEKEDVVIDDITVVAIFF